MAVIASETAGEMTDERLRAMGEAGIREFPNSPNVPKAARFVGHPDADKKFLEWYAGFGDQLEARRVCNEVAMEMLDVVEQRIRILDAIDFPDVAYEPDDWTWLEGEPLRGKSIHFDQLENFELNQRLEARLGVGCLRWTHHRQYCRIAGLVTLER